MGIVHQVGDLLKADVNVICHSVNHQGVMKSGLANQIRQKYPKIISEDEQYLLMCKGLTFLLIKTQGVIAWYRITKDYYIASIFGQDRYGRDKQYTDYVSLGNGLNAVVWMADIQDLTVGIPYGMGCGLGGGSWNVVYDIIERCAVDYPKVQIYIFHNNGAT